MNRPYTVCHILSALDGKISGSFARTRSAAEVSEEYARIRNNYQAEAWLYGTTTTKEFTGYKKPDLPAGYEKVPDGDHIAETNLNFYYISVDTAGEIGWDSGTFRKAGRPDAHVVEILTEKTPSAYRAYLREKGVSYILAGQEQLDCKEAVRKLRQLFGIQTLLICGGGVVNWTFMQQGVVDELSLLLAPAADGASSTPAVFECMDSLTSSDPVEFVLKNIERLQGNGVRLTYLVK